MGKSLRPDRHRDCECGLKETSQGVEKKKKKREKMRD
jgi:hypothetical protein